MRNVDEAADSIGDAKFDALPTRVQGALGELVDDAALPAARPAGVAPAPHISVGFRDDDGATPP